jgi:hypothetical protein
MTSSCTAPLFVVNISPSFAQFTAPLRHILPIHNVTISSNNLFVNFRWKFTFALRNRMTELTSRLAGLWIGAAISNTSHSKPVIPLPNEYGSQVKGQGRWQCCHNKHKKFPYRPIRDISLLSGHASYQTYIWLKKFKVVLELCVCDFKLRSFNRWLTTAYSHSFSLVKSPFRCAEDWCHQYMSKSVGWKLVCDLLRTV